MINDTLKILYQKQMEQNRLIADQLIFLLQTDENAKTAYEDDSFAQTFLNDLNSWSSTTLIRNYYYQGLSQYFPKNVMSLKTFTLMMKEIDLSLYETNAYYQTIKWPSIRQGSWSFDYGVFPAYQPFLVGDVRVDEMDSYEEITPIGFARRPFLYPCLLKNDSIWMSITPFEIETMKEDIHLAKGNILMLGCGMGYAALMMSQKSEVKSITIIENDKDVLSLFKNHVLPQFPHKNKIKFINIEGLAFLEQLPIHHAYDFVYIDIYQTVEDGLPLYLKIKKIEAQIQGSTPWRYWLERSMLAMIRRQLIEAQKLEGFPPHEFSDFRDETIQSFLTSSQ